MRKFKLASCVLSVGCFFFLVPAHLQAEPEYPKVLAVSGEAEILRPAYGWQKLEPDAYLKKGFKVRTKEKSSVEIAWDEGLENVARLDENAHLDILGQNAQSFFLMQGRFFILREESGRGDHSLVRPPMKIFTEDTLIEIGEGGCSVEAANKTTLVKIFGEEAKIYSLKDHHIHSQGRVTREGFKFFSGKMDPRISSPYQRMGYGDYSDWQAWIKACYERKDDRAAEAFQRRPVL